MWRCARIVGLAGLILLACVACVTQPPLDTPVDWGVELAQVHPTEVEADYGYFKCGWYDIDNNIVYINLYAGCDVEFTTWHERYHALQFKGVRGPYSEVAADCAAEHKLGRKANYSTGDPYAKEGDC